MWNFSRICSACTDCRELVRPEEEQVREELPDLLVERHPGQRLLHPGDLCVVEIVGSGLQVHQSWHFRDSFVRTSLVSSAGNAGQ
jgi:hypothetical protein